MYAGCQGVWTMKVRAVYPSRKERGKNARAVSRRFLIALLLFSLLPFLSAPTTAGAVSPLPPQASVIAGGTVGQRFGTQSSHIKLYPPSNMHAELDVVRGAGIGWLRCDFAWFDLEYNRGAWNFTGTDRLVDEAEARGISILGILGTSPPWANGGNRWNFPPTDMGAWRNYVRTVVSRYRGRVPAWEIWNEENIHAFWQPAPDYTAYVNLLAAASQEIRAADPSATIVMGGVAGLDPNYLNKCLQLGAAAYVDAIAYHPYAETIGEEGQPPEATYWPKERLCRLIVDWVHNLVAKYSSRRLQVWVTEVGWTTCAGVPPGVDEMTQASYLLRTMINYAGTDVERVIWFNLRDTWESEIDRYGLVDRNFNPKPSLGYYATFMKVFGPAVARESGVVSFTCSRPATLEAHCFRMEDGDLVLAAWKADDQADTLSLQVNDPSFADPVSVAPLDATETPVPGTARDAEGRLTVSGLAIGKTPVIIRMDRVKVTAVSPRQAYQYTPSQYINDISGSGFQSGASVRLEMGSTVIAASNVKVQSEGHLTCSVGLWGAAPGTYDVVVINPDGSRARLASAFKVVPPCGGGGAVILVFVTMMGLLATVGYLYPRRRIRRGEKP